jgi:hypothetical protein
VPRSGNSEFNFPYISCFIYYHATNSINIPHFLWWFWSIIICIVDCCLEIKVTLIFSTFISTPYYLLIVISPSIMPCSTACILAGKKSLFAYLIVRNSCPPTLESQKLSRASLVNYRLFKFNTICKKRKRLPCLTPLPIFTLLLCPSSSYILTLWYINGLLIDIFIFAPINK